MFEGPPYVSGSLLRDLCSMFLLPPSDSSHLLSNSLSCLFPPFPSPLTTLFLPSKKCHQAQTFHSFLPSPLTLFPVPCSLAILTRKACKHTLTTSLSLFPSPFPLANTSFSLCLYKPLNVSYGALSPAPHVLTDPPVFPSLAPSGFSCFLSMGEKGAAVLAR